MLEQLEGVGVIKKLLVVAFVLGFSFSAFADAPQIPPADENMLPPSFTTPTSTSQATPISRKLTSLQAPTQTMASLSILQNLEAHRNYEGEVYLTGKANLPKSTNITATLLVHGQQNTSVFNGKEFANYEEASSKVESDGFFKISFFTYFDEKWVADVYDVELTAFGKFYPPGVANVEEVNRGFEGRYDDLVPDDPDFPKGVKHFDAKRTVEVPDLTSAQQAIARVKLASLFVTGKGQSGEPVGWCIRYFEDPKNGYNLKVLGWFAKKSNENTWEVTLRYFYSDELNKKYMAKWSFNSNDNTVNYLDPNSKLFSYLGSEEWSAWMR